MRLCTASAGTASVAVPHLWYSLNLQEYSCPGPQEPTPHRQTIFCEIHINIILPLPHVSQVALLLRYPSELRTQRFRNFRQYKASIQRSHTLMLLWFSD